MFDYEHQRRIQMGQNPDKALIATFRYEFDPKTQQQVPYINIFLSKNNTVDRPATREDMERFEERWKAFQKGEDKPPDGLPINQVPFATPAEISICKTERIYTVEQLIEMPDDRLQRAGVLNFRYRCADMMKQLKDSGHITKMRDEIEGLKKQLIALQEQNAELKAGLQEEQPNPPKRRGARKTDGNTAGDRESGTA